MSGRRPPARSPWLGEGKTFAATRLSGVRRSAMSDEAAFGFDARPGGVDGREPLRCDADRFGRQAARDAAVGMALGHALAVEALEVRIAHGAVGSEHRVRVIVAP